MPSIYKMKTNSVMRDEKGEYVIKNELFNSNSIFNESTRPNLVYDIYYNPKTLEVRCEELSNKHVHKDYFKISPKSNNNGSNK
jgi:adenine-specific DNA-methyltransferase